MTATTVGARMRLTPLVALLGVLAAACLALGLFFGFSSINRLGTDCGSAFGGYNAQAADTADLGRAMQADTAGTVDTQQTATADACQSAVSDRKPIADGLIVVGAVFAVASIVTLTVGAQPRPSSSPFAP